MMPVHYIGLYALVEVKNADNDEELQRNEGMREMWEAHNE